MVISLRRIRLPCFDGLLGQFPMLEAFHHPIEIMCFGFELTDGVGGIGGDEYFLSGFRQHADLNLAECVGRDILFEMVHQLEVFVGDFEDRSPDLFAW